MRSKPVARKLAQGSSDEGEAAGGSGGGAGGGSENAEMEENSSLRSTSSSSSSGGGGAAACPPVPPFKSENHEYARDFSLGGPADQLDYHTGRREDAPRSQNSDDERRPWDPLADKLQKIFYRNFHKYDNALRQEDDYYGAIKQESTNLKDYLSSVDWASLLPDSLQVCTSYSDGLPVYGLFIRAVKEIPEGTRFGPYVGNWDEYSFTEMPFSSFDDSKDWMKLIRVASNPENVNLRKIKDKDGNIYLEASRNISPREKLLLGCPEQSLCPTQRRVNNEDENTSEYASQHSGQSHADEDREDEEDGEIRCTVCDKPFQDIELLNKHLVICHRYPVGEHTCLNCPNSYAWRPLLVRHRAIVHGDIRKYPCENCPRPDDPQVFTDPSNLQRHIRTHHVGARSHACTECGKTFATSSGLKQHTHIHSSVKPFQCEVCFKAYTQFSNLCRHKRMHAKCRAQITCGKCRAQFSTVTSLTKHKRFCDSTAPPPPRQAQSAGITPGMPQPQTNPFLFPRQPMPFYPIFNQYSAQIFRNNESSAAAAAAAAAGNFLGLPLVFPPKPATAADEQPPMSERSREHSRLPEERFTPPRAAPPATSAQQPAASKVSPSAAEEATSSLRPSPARPPPAQSGSEEAGQLPLKRRRSPSSEDADEQRQQDGGSEQPLDLSVRPKRPKVEEDNDGDEELEVESEPEPTPSPERRRSEEPSHSRPSSRVKSEQRSERPPSESKDLGSPPARNSMPAPPPENQHQQHQQHQPVRTPTPPPAPQPHIPAYPRPIHPLFLESMYRNPSNSFPVFQGAGPVEHRLLQTLPSFGPSRGLPFLEPLMNGLGGPRTGGYGMLSRTPLSGFPGVKPFQDSVMAAAHHHQQPGPFAGKVKDRYSCKFCGKNFPRSANLTRHLRTHTGEQPYKCKYCERSFSISSNLQRHVRNIHDKQRPFKCTKCERCFGQQTNLDRHLKKHEADDGSGVVSLADSADSSNENEREDTSTYFDEIRSFMGKVTYGGGAGAEAAYGLPAQHPAYLPSRLRAPHEYLDGVLERPKYNDEEDSEDGASPLAPAGGLSPLDRKEASPFDLKIAGKRELLNNNTAEPVIEITT